MYEGKEFDGSRKFTDEAVREPHVRVFDMTGRPMKGCLLVESKAVDSDEQLRSWIGMSVDFIGSLAPK